MFHLDAQFIDWQKCVITESLNAEMVKAENPDAVVATEPQGKNQYWVWNFLITHPYWPKPAVVGKWWHIYYSQLLTLFSFLSLQSSRRF